MCKFIQKELVSGNEGDQTLVALETIESGAIGPRIRIDIGYFRGICERICGDFRKSHATAGFHYHIW